MLVTIYSAIDRESHSSTLLFSKCLKYYSCFKFVREMAFVYSRFAFEVNDFCLDCAGDVLYNLGQVFQKLVNVNPGLNVN